MATHALLRAIDRAHALLDEGRADRARTVLEAALADRAGAEPLDVATALGLSAVALRDVGETTAAEARFAEARALLAPRTEPDARRALGALLEDLAELELELRRPDTARSLLREAIAAEREAGDAIEAETWLALGEAELACGDAEAAIAAAERASDAGRRADDAEAVALARELGADARASTVDDDAARAGYDDALARWRAVGDAEGTARVLVALARLDERRDDADAVAARGAELAAIRALDPELREELEAEIRELLASLGR